MNERELLALVAAVVTAGSLANDVEPMFNAEKAVDAAQWILDEIEKRSKKAP